MKPKLADKKRSSKPINKRIRFFLHNTRLVTPAMKIKVGIKIVNIGIGFFRYVNNIIQAITRAKRPIASESAKPNIAYANN